MKSVIVLLPLWFSLVIAQLHPSKPAEYQRLPSLRETACIQDGWKNERIARMPSLLKKYDLDAWLVCALSNTTESDPQNEIHLDDPERACRRSYLVVYQKFD